MSDTKHSSQSTDNRSFNDTYEMYEHIGYGYEAATGEVHALAVDNSGDLKVSVYDSTGAELELIKENDNFNAASHGIIVYGLDRESNPQKYRQIDADNQGHLRVHVLDNDNNIISGDQKYEVLYATEYGATYNYIMRYQRGSTKWEIQRETVATSVRDYAASDSNLGTAWANRASQTYGSAT